MPSADGHITIEELISIYNAGKANQAYLIDVSRALEAVSDANTDIENKALSFSLTMPKSQLIQEYVFDASAKTIEFSSFSSVELSRIMLITNVTSNVIIYNFSDSTLGGSVTGNTLTLDYNTASMDDGDDIQIYYDMGSLLKLIDEGATATYVGQAQDGSLESDPVWQIQKIDTSSGVSILWADGNNKFDNIWDDRATLTYS